jgi:hypothetical protein
MINASGSPRGSRFRAEQSRHFRDDPSTDLGGRGDPFSYTWLAGTVDTRARY